MTVTREQVRNVALAKQRLSGRRPKADPSGLLDVARSLRCLQIDPTNVVARTEYLVWWSRVGRYDRAEADRLMWVDKSLFHYWAHAASLVLTEDYPIHRARMRAYGTTGTLRRRVREWVRDNARLKRHILTELRKRGPLTSSDFADLSEQPWRSDGWTGGRNVAHMLEFLWAGGQVLVAGRVANKRLWDLTERVLPAATPTESLTLRKATERSALLSLRALGIATKQHINRHFIRGEYVDLPVVLERAVRAGEVAEVSVHGSTAPWFMDAADLPLLRREKVMRTTLLSPFDNLICDRARTKELFGFDYTIEIYVPKAKRVYGYYSLPILHEGRLIGRLDPAFDRKAGVLKVNSVHLESNGWANGPTGRAVGAAIEELASFVGADAIAGPPELPRGWRAAFA